MSLENKRELKKKCMYVGNSQTIERGTGILCNDEQRLKDNIAEKGYESISDKFCCATCFSNYTGHARSDVDIEPEKIDFCKYKKI